ncbi:MAG TPA: preQ(1) synthase [Candidatus Omnitrophota bacterium]|nr:preQ(1) synthase [Candidatus Omnitrophota bacterium]HQL41123.1 preQ(1) synthase [Candidatus Omnitrophota bacterium]
MARKTYEHLQEKIRRLKTPRIDVWNNKYADREYLIDLSTDEFTCICPKTGLPDFATIKVWYKPGKKCLELKSFKYYLMFYRDIGIFHEHLTNKILDDVVNACQPRWAKVEVVMKPRGGIQTVVAAEYPQSC